MAQPANKTVMTFDQKLDVMTFMKTVCEGDRTECTYKDGWNDERVNEWVNKELHIKSSVYGIASVRKAAFGELKVVKPITLEEQWQAKFDVMQATVNQLLYRVVELENHTGLAAIKGA